MSRRKEAAAIFGTHGPADAATTIAASRTVGTDLEANPIVRSLLEISEPATVIVMCGCVAVAAGMWPTAADAIDAPPAAAAVVAGTGAIVAAINLWVSI